MSKQTTQPLYSTIVRRQTLNGFIVIIAVLLFTGFNLIAQQKKSSVGDIAFDLKTDDPKFRFCNPSFVLQGYELKTSADESQIWISNQLKRQFVYKSLWSSQTGFITVRFAVNCFGLTDRFRAMGVNSELHSAEFPNDLALHLIKLVKEIKWPVQSHRMQTVDYYQEVIFKLVKGELKEVLL